MALKAVRLNQVDDVGPEARAVVLVERRLLPVQKQRQLIESDLALAQTVQQAWIREVDIKPLALKPKGKGL